MGARLTAEEAKQISKAARAELRRSGVEVPYVKGQDAAPIWARLTRVGECWEYAYLHPWTGYGIHCVGKKVVLAHRFMWSQLHGREPPGVLMHKCDNPACCRPDHLVLGTQAQNIADKVAKARQAKGTNINTNVLSEEDVLAIRARAVAGESYAAIARDYPTSKENIRYIVLRKTWAWLN